MTRAGKSVFYFGIYGILVGTLACLIPVQFIAAFKLPEISAAWARMIGLLVIIIGTYDIISGRNSFVPMLKGTVYMRIIFFIGTLILFATGQMPKEIIPLGTTDLLGALWTMFSLKADAKALTVKDA